MKIIEQNITGKINAETCEDGIVVTENHVAVIDGSTSKGAQLYEGEKNGRVAMKVASFLIECLDEECDVDFCMEILTQGIRAMYSKDSLAQVTAHKEDRLTFSTAIYSRLRQEVWMIGDCQVMVNGELYLNEKPTEQPMAEERSRIIKEHIAEGMTTEEILQEDPGRKAIMPMLLDSMAQQQVSYAVVDGFPIPRKKVRVINVPDGAEVVLATDGYPFLKPTLAESEEALAHQLEIDPLMIGEFKATKAYMKGQNSFDDRAYVRFEN